ncbi:hypothetical protein LX32DRAFT_165320 [Colletotrichum zoysiae]|uniref:Uncharacterized protein n=1 Tax=Colletotrichum zoysiae TaxID=1216348 RepID=A0AAD9LVT6_9PEZI|nr:hypothetical protein LX32DRAFT_165320 [Colletotrichum zoysiae]
MPSALLPCLAESPEPARLLALGVTIPGTLCRRPHPHPPFSCELCKLCVPCTTTTSGCGAMFPQLGPPGKAACSSPAMLGLYIVQCGCRSFRLTSQPASQVGLRTMFLKLHLPDHRPALTLGTLKFGHGGTLQKSAPGRLRTACLLTHGHDWSCRAWGVRLAACHAITSVSGDPLFCHQAPPTAHRLDDQLSPGKLLDRQTLTIHPSLSLSLSRQGPLPYPVAPRTTDPSTIPRRPLPTSPTCRLHL